MNNKQMRTESPLASYMQSKAAIRGYANEIGRIVQSASSASRNSQQNAWIDSSLGIICSYMNESAFTSVDLCFALIATQYEQLLNHNPVQAEMFFKCFVKFVDDHGSSELAECLHRYTLQRDISELGFEKIQTCFNQEMSKSQPDWIKIEIYLEQEPTLDVNIRVHHKPVFERLVHKYIENGNRADLKNILALLQAASLRIDESKFCNLLHEKLERISIQQTLTLVPFFHDQCVLQKRRIYMVLHSIKAPTHFNKETLSSSECDIKSILNTFLIERCLDRQAKLSM